MPKPPIILPIARSKSQSVFHAALGLGLCVAASWVVPLWFVVGLGLCVAFVLWRQYLAQPEGVLQLTKHGSQLSGRWLLVEGELGKELPVRFDYVGPWLLGLYVGAERLWLWPDSLPGASHRAVRRLCHRSGR